MAENKSKTQTSKDAATQKNSSTNLDNLQKAQAKELNEAKKVKVSIPKMLRRRLGKVHPVVINGVAIFVAVDGKQHEVPEPYAKVLNESINNIEE